MTTSHLAFSPKPFLASLLWQIAFPIVYSASIYLYYPFRSEFAMDLDEGINLIKAFMVVHGFSLYRQIWSDQPPLLTYLLTLEFKALGPKIIPARLLILGLACILIWALFQFLTINAGRLHAFIGVVLLIVLPEFIRLSVSVMIGLPAITFAMLSLLALSLWHRRRKYAWLILSAVALGLSISTKLVTAFLIPVFLTGILVDSANWKLHTAARFNRLLPVVIWGFGLTAMLGLLVITVGIDNLGQLFENHLAVSQLDVFRNDPTLRLNFHLKESLPLLILAFFSTGFILRPQILSLKERVRKSVDGAAPGHLIPPGKVDNLVMFYPLAWLVVAYIALFRRIPSWDHHQLFVTIPAAISAAYVVGEVLCGLVGAIRARLNQSALNVSVSTATLSILLLFLFVRMPKVITQFNAYPSIRTPAMRQTSAEVRFLTLIRKYAPVTHWMVTDQPMYAVRTELPVPPSLAVFTKTRVFTGQLQEAEVLETIREYQPEQVLLFPSVYPLLESFLENGYSQIHSTRDARLYIRQDIYQHSRFTDPTPP